MLRPGRVALLCALAALLAGVTAPVAASAQGAAPRTVVLALWQGGPRSSLSFAGKEEPREPADLFLRGLARRPALSIGLMSQVQGDYTQEQALLDITQGTRQSTVIYQPRDVVPLAFRPIDGYGVVDGWQTDVRRAQTASTTIRPGLLASSIPGGAAWVGVSGANADGSIAAADESGRVAAVSLGPPATLGARARALLGSKRFVVVSLPADPTGMRTIDQLIAARAPGELLVIAQVPFTQPLRGYAKYPPRYFKQTAVAIDDGRGPRGITSATTREDGLVSGIDVLPTVLTHLGLPVPRKARGEVITPAKRVSAKRLEGLRRRWADVRDGRQSSTIRGVVALSILILLVLGTLRGFVAALAPAIRIGALALMWWPAMVLVGAVAEPSRRLVETALIAVGCTLLAIVTDRITPWPRGTIIPAAVTVAAYTIDLAGGFDLLTRSALGPSVAFGARFYGISNELEPLLPILVLAGLAPLMAARPPSRRKAAIYAATGVVLGIIVGWGRIGADVGGVLTVAGAFTIATLVMLPGGVTRRALVVAALVPVAAIAALILLDLGLSGGDHLSRNLLRAENLQELWELVYRRYELAAQSLVRGRTPAYFLGAALAAAFAWRNRGFLYSNVSIDPAWRALLLGGLAAGVVGMLTNDSGPVLLINAVVALGAVTAYVLAKPGAFVPPRPAGADRPTPDRIDEPPAKPVLTG
ncbi:MAG: hypothetical protein ACJ76S_01660 [Solirubrobacteraceae bacterium]